MMSKHHLKTKREIMIMTLLKIARRPPVTARPENTVNEAVALMVKEDVGAVIVTNDENQLLGIFTERDNLWRVTNAGVDPKATRVSEVMSVRVQTAPPEIDVDRGLAMMIRNHLRHLPIVDSSNHVLAIASLRYLLMRRIGEKESAIETLSAYVHAGGPG
jgi:CBS domain-containing protein